MGEKSHNRNIFMLLFELIMPIPHGGGDIGVWCNGSTIDFGSISLSSNLGSPTNYITLKIMKSIYKPIDVAITNVKRLNNLKAKRCLTSEELMLFNLYKTILKANDTGVYTSEVKEIIYND